MKKIKIENAVVNMTAYENRVAHPSTTYAIHGHGIQWELVKVNADGEIEIIGTYRNEHLAQMNLNLLLKK